MKLKKSISKLLMGIQDGIFDDANRNIKAAQKWQKNYDKRHRDKGEELSIGDLVVKEQEKNKSRKGDKLEKVREDKLFVIEEILPNGNITLQDMDKNLLKPFSIPMKYVKKIQIGELHSSETTHTMTIKMTDPPTKTTKIQRLTDEMDVDVNMLTQNMTNAMTQELTTSTAANTWPILTKCHNF